MGDAAAEIFERTIRDEYLAALRYDDRLGGELLFDADGAAVCANAHRSGGIEADERVLRRVTDGEGLGLELRGVNRECWLCAGDARVNDAGVERDGEQVYGFQDREMGWAADCDLAAFDEVDTRLAGAHADIAAAAQDRASVALHDFDVHGALNGNGFALDGPDRVVGGLVGLGGGREIESGEENGG